LGRSALPAASGSLAKNLGWSPFFLLTSIISLPALFLLHWLSKRRPQGAGES
jgi:PAT family beta-lactamase induction signal transducer AmpG